MQSDSQTNRSIHAGRGTGSGVAIRSQMEDAAVQEASIKMMSFPGMTTLPAIVAQKKGLFEKHGVKIEVLLTPNSQVQREGLASGDHQIIHTAADNSIAMTEVAKADSVIVMGGDNAFNRIFVQPDVKSLTDLRGRTVAVDAPNTAFALLLYRALQEAGLKEGDYKTNPVGGTSQRLDLMLADKSNAAAVLNPPFSFHAEDAGLKDLGPVRTHHSGSVVVMREWAKRNSDTLVRYLRAIIEGRRRLLDPANKTEMVQLIAEQAKLSPDIAERTHALITHPQEGFEIDGRFDMQGFRDVLNLRAGIYDQWKGKPPGPEKYVDLSYYKKALSGL